MASVNQVLHLEDVNCWLEKTRGVTQLQCKVWIYFTIFFLRFLLHCQICTIFSQNNFLLVQLKTREIFLSTLPMVGGMFELDYLYGPFQPNHFMILWFSQCLWKKIRCTRSWKLERETWQKWKKNRLALVLLRRQMACTSEHAVSVVRRKCF